MRRWAILIACACAEAASASEVIVAPLWEYEPLDSNQGVISLEARGEGFPKRGNEPIQILTKHLATQNIFLISQPLLWTKERQRSLYWKLPAGKYEVVQIARVHNGKPHVATKDPRFRYFIVESFALTDLGVWVPRPSARRALTVTFHTRMVQSFIFPKGDDSIDAIIDGFSGSRLEAIGGRGHKRRAALALAARTGRPVSVPARGSGAFDLAYRMELNHYEKFSASLMPSIKTSEGLFRQCQLAGSGSRGNSEGSARFAFSLAKERDTFKTLIYRGGTLANRSMIQCLQVELARLRFPTTSPIHGDVVFDFK